MKLLNVTIQFTLIQYTISVIPPNLTDDYNFCVDGQHNFIHRDLVEAIQKPNILNRLKALLRAGSFITGCMELYIKLNVREECKLLYNDLLKSLYNLSTQYIPKAILGGNIPNKHLLTVFKAYQKYDAPCNYNYFNNFVV